jgi:hypothetical protein
MTLHGHAVDGKEICNDGKQLMHVPEGWHIAPGDADDVRVCAVHPWQCCVLVFANGESYYTGYFVGTSAAHSTGMLSHDKFVLQLQNSHRKSIHCNTREQGKKRMLLTMIL